MMLHARKTVLVNRPVESVFEFVLNGTNNRLWKRSVLDVRPLGEAPYAAGSKFQQQVIGPEGPVAGDYQITECKMNELIGVEVMSGPARWSGQYRFRGHGRGTEVSCELTAEREGPGAMTDASLQHRMEAEAATLNELKAFLEKMA